MTLTAKERATNIARLIKRRESNPHAQLPLPEAEIERHITEAEQEAEMRGAAEIQTLRAEVEHLNAACETYLKQIDHEYAVRQGLVQDIDEVKRERDEARAACAEIIKFVPHTPHPNCHRCNSEKANPGQPILDRLERLEKVREAVAAYCADPPSEWFNLQKALAACEPKEVK